MYMQEHFIYLRDTLDKTVEFILYLYFVIDSIDLSICKRTTKERDWRLLNTLLYQVLSAWTDVVAWVEGGSPFVVV